MYSLFVYNDGYELLAEYKDVNSETETINKYLNSTNKHGSDFKYLGGLSGDVYRMNFSMVIDGIESEYMIIHNP